MAITCYLQFIRVNPGWTGEQFQLTDRVTKWRTSHQWYISESSWYTHV